MPNSSVLAAATKTAINSKPCNYGVNQVTWNAPSNYSPWISMRLLKKFGGPSTSEQDGVILYEKDSNNYIFAPTTVGSTGVGTFTFSGGSATIPSSATISNFTYTTGGTITLTGGTTTSSIKTFSIGTLVYNQSPITYNNVSATGGSGTGAKFNVAFDHYTPGSGYYPTVTVSSGGAGSGYAVGDTLTISSSLIGASANLVLTVVSITSTVSQTYLVSTTTTSGSGTGAVFNVTRTGTSGTANAYVSNIQLVSGGSGYAVGDTVTINGTYTGGTSGTNNVTVTITAVTTSSSTVEQVFTNVAQSSTSGSGTGATFDVYRKGTAGSSATVWQVLVRNKGTGYSTTNTITINGSLIGGTTGAGNLTITITATDGGGGLLASSANYVTGSAFTSRYSGTAINTAVALVNQKSQTYTDVPVVSADGVGRGAKATVVRNSSGAVSTVTITESGSGYAADDLLVIPASYIGDYQTERVQLGTEADFHLFDNFYPPYQVQTRTTSNISNLSSATRTLDGYTYGLNDFVLVANQTTAANNGLYKATSTGSTTAVLTKQTDYDGSYIHVLNGTTNGGRVYSNSGTSFTQTTAPVVNPGKGKTGNNVGGKEVYYTLYVRTVSITGTNTGTVSWGSLGYTTDTYVENTGLHQWLIDHLPSWYFEGSDDLSDFLALFAFHLECYKQHATSIFDMTDPGKTPEQLLSAWLSQFGTDYHLATDSKSARKLLANIIAAYSKKGSISGVDLISESIVGLPATVTSGVNLLPDVNTASFEQALGSWVPKLTSTSPITFSGVSNLGALGISLQNGPVGSLAPYGSAATNAVTGMAKIVNNMGATSTVSYQIGPRRATSTTTSKITTSVSPSYYLYYLTPDVAENGDYVVSVDSDRQTYLKPGTTAYDVQPTTNTAYISDPPVTSTQEVPANAMYYFSKTGTDITSTLADYLPIVPTSTYVFSTYVGFPTGGTARAVTVGIEWLDSNGNSISSTTTTLASAAQSANTWYRVERNGTAPANAMYASPYVSIVSMATTDTGYYMDAAQFELGSTASTYEDPRIVTISIPSSTTAQRQNMAAVLGDYIAYGQGPIGTAGATITGVSASIERIGQESPITYPTAYSASGTALTLTVPTGHGFVTGDEIVVSDLYAGGGIMATTANTVASITSTTDTTIVFSSALGAGSGAITKGSVSKLKGYNFIYTSTTPHGMVPGHQITVTGLTPSNLNLSNATVIGTPNAYDFVAGFSSTTTVITSTVSSGSGTIYVDFGRSGSTRLTS